MRGVQNEITLSLIPKHKLEDGVYYYGICRNANIARWNAAKQHFVYWRTKFNYRYIETIKHPEDDNVFDVFRPYARVEDLGNFISIEGFH